MSSIGGIPVRDLRIDTTYLVNLPKGSYSHFWAKLVSVKDGVYRFRHINSAVKVSYSEDELIGKVFPMGHIAEM